MTTQQLIDYYAKLLILQYVSKPKAFATIQARVKPIIMDQLPLLVQAAFNLNTAVGVQLDILGKYAGVSRAALTFTGPITLNDSDFRILIKLKIIENNSGSSLADIQSLISMYFPTSIRVFDYQNMHMDYFFDSTFGSVDLAEVFVRQGLLPKPMGVQLGALIYSPSINNFFGMRTYAFPAVGANGFNSYTSYQTNWPWLSYADAITP